MPGRLSHGIAKSASVAGSRRAAGIPRSGLPTIWRRAAMARRVFGKHAVRVPRFYFVGDDDLLGMLGGGIEGASRISR